MIIRTLGFDVKKFDFASDIREMEVTSDDNEEIEITLGVDSDKIVRGVRRYFRELGYYYKENKMIILSLLAIFVVAVAIYFILSVNIFNKVYKENDTVVNSDYAMKVTDSYLSNLDISGNNVSLKNSTYVIVKLKLQATSDENKKMQTEYLMLKVGNKRYDPIKKYYKYYSDIGTGYSTQKLTYGKSMEYILMFSIDKDDINKKMLLTNVITDNSIRIKPTSLDNASLVSEAKLNEKLEYKDTVIGSGSITINNYETSNRIENIIAGYNKTVLKLGVDTNIDNYTNYDFLNTFVTIKMEKDGKSTVLDFENRTSKIDNNNIYVEGHVPDIYIGGNGARILYWITGGGSYDRKSVRLKVLKNIILSASGLQSDVDFNIYLSNKPKIEVAMGMLEDRPVQSMFNEEKMYQKIFGETEDEYVLNSVLSGAGFKISDTVKSDRDFVSAKDISAGIAIDDVNELDNFVKTFNENRKSIWLNGIKIDDVQRNEIKKRINSYYVSEKGKKVKEIHVEPIFIIGLKKLMEMLTSEHK